MAIPTESRGQQFFQEVRTWYTDDYPTLPQRVSLEKILRMLFSPEQIQNWKVEPRIKKRTIQHRTSSIQNQSSNTDEVKYLEVQIALNEVAKTTLQLQEGKETITRVLNVPMLLEFSFNPPNQQNSLLTFCNRDRAPWEDRTGSSVLHLNAYWDLVRADPVTGQILMFYDNRCGLFGEFLPAPDESLLIEDIDKWVVNTEKSSTKQPEKKDQEQKAE